jgi:hypothetical protein
VPRGAASGNKQRRCYQRGARGTARGSDNGRRKGTSEPNALRAQAVAPEEAAIKRSTGAAAVPRRTASREQESTLSHQTTASAPRPLQTGGIVLLSIAVAVEQEPPEPVCPDGVAEELGEAVRAGPDLSAGVSAPSRRSWTCPALVRSAATRSGLEEAFEAATKVSSPPRRSRPWPRGWRPRGGSTAGPRRDTP